MTSRKALGRGLDALIPQAPAPRSAPDVTTGNVVDQVHQIPLEQIVPNRRQPRTAMDDTALDELADSIKERGVLEPLIVRPIDEGRYELVAGERRLRASARAGRTEVPVLFREYGERAALEIALIENIQREDLNPVDEARAYQRLVEEFSRTHAEVSKAVGKDRSTITNLLRLLRLPEGVLSHVSRGTLSVGHGRALLGIESGQEQIVLAERMVREAWSVRQAEREISQRPPKQKVDGDKRDKGHGTKGEDQTQKPRDPQVIRIEEAIRNVLGTEVHLNHGPAGGQIEIRYFSDEELERILELLRVEVY